jgi:hypothetical protein
MQLGEIATQMNKDGVVAMNFDNDVVSDIVLSSLRSLSRRMKRTTCPVASWGHIS